LYHQLRKLGNRIGRNKFILAKKCYLRKAYHYALEYFKPDVFLYSYKDYRFIYPTEPKIAELFFYSCINNNGETREGLNIDLLEKLCRRHSTIIDIGAHLGLYSVILGTIKPDANLYCFEPSEENLDVLKVALNLNGIEATEIRDEVVSDHEGKVAFYYSSDPAQHSIVRDTIGIIPNQKRRFKKCISISKYLIEKDISNAFIKIDVEGGEYVIIKDFINNILRGVGNYCILCEIHPSRLKMAGYSSDQLYRLLDNNKVRYYSVNYEGRQDTKHIVIHV